MRIGQLAQLTDTQTRLLRYYEEQGLIVPRRLPNGYREYDDYLVNRVIQIRGLLDAGLPTRIIGQILPCLDKPRRIIVDDAKPELLAVLAEESNRMSERIDCLIRNRDAINSYIVDVNAALSTQKAESAA